MYLERLKEIRQGSAFSGLGCALSFFSGVNRPSLVTHLMAVFPMYFNYFEKGWDSTAMNFLGSLITDFLSLSLKFGLGLSEESATILSALIIACGTEVAIRKEGDDDYSQNALHY